MSDKPSHRTSPTPTKVQKRFEKKRSRMGYHAIKGAWGCFPNKQHRGIMGPRCPACD